MQRQEHRACFGRIRGREVVELASAVDAVHWSVGLSWMSECDISGLICTFSGFRGL